MVLWDLWMLKPTGCQLSNWRTQPSGSSQKRAARCTHKFLSGRNLRRGFTLGGSPKRRWKRCPLTPVGSQEILSQHLEVGYLQALPTGSGWKRMQTPREKLEDECFSSFCAEPRYIAAWSTCTSV